MRFRSSGAILMLVHLMQMKKNKMKTRTIKIIWELSECKKICRDKCALMSLVGSMTFNNVLNATECVFNFYDYVYRKTAIKMHSIDKIYIHKREVHASSSLVLKKNGIRNGCNKFSDIDRNVCSCARITPFQTFVLTHANAIRSNFLWNLLHIDHDYDSPH